MKSTVVDESLSTNETSSVPEKSTLLLQETTECKTYLTLYYVLLVTQY